MRRLPFSVELRHPVMGVTTRSGYLIEGPAGWGECSPLPSWSNAERDAAWQSALEAATVPFPAAVRDRVPVNAMIPRLAPDVAAAPRLSMENRQGRTASGACRTLISERIAANPSHITSPRATPTLPARP